MSTVARQTHYIPAHGKGTWLRQPMSIFGGISVAAPSLAFVAFVWWTFSGAQVAAVTTFVLGLVCAVGFVFSVAALILGSNETHRNPRSDIGSGTVTAAILGMTGCVVLSILGIVVGMTSVFASASY
jgi:hypothetical protein